ncbi:helix-turn-helix domain-containing protein [Flavobacterium agricola]|uniref:Helix-turn-helix domain-containing protein n=1 Tax=Flavobacterium agricola TaxID=2870839 RepID=A0ABY6M331_9FLAO|nr:helix-turn-helix domain-containing protein [Flavobacterium agricola]UYW01768.1 helix-turn-helix domain-containing protein [Flavobacterium agricola]
MNEIRFIQVTPEQLKEVVSEAVKVQLEDFKKSFEKAKDENLLNSDEAADFFKISKVTLWRWRKDGTVPFLRKGSKVYFKRSDIESAMVAMQE